MVPLRSHTTTTLSSRCNRPWITSRHLRSYSDLPPRPRPDHRASSQLFADAAKEEAGRNTDPATSVGPDASSQPNKNTKSSRLIFLESQRENWTGEESIQDAVLRMLVDKYKPLRSGSGVKTVEEKMKENPPKIVQSSTLGSVRYMPLEDSPEGSGGKQRTGGDVEGPKGEEGKDYAWFGGGHTQATVAENVSRAHQDLANVPLLPSIEGHQPWHTTFTVPSHSTSNIKYGHIPSPKLTKNPSLDKSLKKENNSREARKRTEVAGRLSGAKESALDYKLGLKGKGAAATPGQARRPNPATLKGWASLVEDKIERARIEGQFRNLKGRGAPIQQVVEEKNPFIAREEFLMNRIVQRNGAVPPWVEIQRELDSAVTTFREILRQSWTRRAVRMLTLAHPPTSLTNLTLTSATSLRDTERVSRERAYHDSAVEELNSLVRKYNAMAPYAVRRPYYVREVELEKAYKESGEDILRGIVEGMKVQPVPDVGSVNVGNEGDEKEGGGGVGTRGSATSREGREMEGWLKSQFREMIRQWFSQWTGSSRSKT